MSAIEFLKKAVKYDSCGRKMEAVKLYECGIAELLKTCKGVCDSKINKSINNIFVFSLINKLNCGKDYNKTKNNIIN